MTEYIGGLAMTSVEADEARMIVADVRAKLDALPVAVAGELARAVVSRDA